MEATMMGEHSLLGFFAVQTISQHDPAFSIPKNIIRKSLRRSNKTSRP
jgi:hypothetical protein